MSHDRGRYILHMEISRVIAQLVQNLSVQCLFCGLRIMRQLDPASYCFLFCFLFRFLFMVPKDAVFRYWVDVNGA
jgi:hypothetical protein